MEDEALARKTLAGMLRRLFPEIIITGETGSVAETVEWLENPGNRADLIFMDVELSDGNCFEIFRRTEVKPYVIMTTAYDNYAIKAFKVESVDYILKPVEPDELQKAVEKVKARISAGTDRTPQQTPAGQNDKTQRERFLIRINDMIVPVNVSDIAYFYAEDKSTYLMTSGARKYVIDFSLDVAMEQLDGSRFFRISRNCIVAMSAISSLVKIGSRYMIATEPKAAFEMMVSRSRTDDFIHWLEGGK